MFASERSERMTWKYEDDECRRGLVETEKHVLYECTLDGCKKFESWYGGI